MTAPLNCSCFTLLYEIIWKEEEDTAGCDIPRTSFPTWFGEICKHSINNLRGHKNSVKNYKFKSISHNSKCDNDNKV